MAEILAEIIKVVFHKLANESLKRIVRSQGIHSELNELVNTLSHIQDLLNDASYKEVTNKSVKQWLNSLQHLSYNIDDVLDDLATEAMHLELTHESREITSKVRQFIPTCFTNLSLSHRLRKRLDSITTELQHLERRKNDLGLIVKDEKPKNTSRRNETSLQDVSIVVGRDGEIDKLLSKLLSDESFKENFSILPIVGMGGVGKTTLARLLYNNNEVKDHFEVKAWVCVSDDFDIFKISDTIFHSLTTENKDFKDLNQLQIALTKQLKDKRFLIVLDDVWTENFDDWDNLARPFHLGAPGSRIIITTRKEQLLIKLGFDYLERLESLSHEDALCLFALHALGVDNFKSHTTLKPQGEGIVKKCGGLPLTLRSLGRLMRTKTHEEEWDEVLNSEIWDLENVDEIIPGLRVSYHDLSTDLKHLFMYCSLFPKDFLFDKEELVILWMAEGFLNESNTTKSPERLGHEHFENLLSRSFFQHAPNEESLFVMHDTLNDLATFVAGEFFLRFDNHMKMGNEALEKLHYMSFNREEYVGYHKFKEFKRATSLRTLLAVSVGVDQSWDHFYLSNKILVDLLPQLPLLRVLSLSSFDINEVPEFIGSLKHLRYLNLSQTKIKELPENVGNLYNLQTLIVFGCQSLIKLPKSFLKLKKLRHFDIWDTPLLEKLPLGICELKSLQTLTKIIIEGDDGFKLTKLKELKNLYGKISIEGLHKVQSVMEARGMSLSLKMITRLELNWGDVFDGSQRSTFDKDVLNELKPHGDRLKRLKVEGYSGIKFPNWVGDPSFHELVHVSIHECGNCSSLPPLGQLPLLKKLLIGGMNEVKVISSDLIGANVVAFPSLEILEFDNMWGWEVWSTNSMVLKSVFPCLRELYISGCPSLNDISLEAIPSLRVLKVHGCSNGVLRSLVQTASSITKLEILLVSGLTNEVWRGVIHYLGAVEDLQISSCDELRYLWETEAEASKVLDKLKKLNVQFCSNLMSLGEKEDGDLFKSNLLSSLRTLDVWYCDNIKSCFCPNNIESLSIMECRSLTRVSFPTTQGRDHKLKSLLIQDCKKLMENIHNDPSMPMLEYIDISGWTNLKSIIQLSNFIHLTSLYIKDCPSIESFPDIQLLKLTDLSIENCQSMESFPYIQLPNLTSLQHLEIIKCPSIDTSFPCGHWPPKLCSLRIGGLKKTISEWGPQNFPTSLVNLDLYGGDMNNFSQLSHLLPSSLIGLGIYKFDKLKSLSIGLQHLTSIQHLIIEKCPKIKHLPETLLPSLLTLGIYECRNLEKRCNGRGSHYWPLISHIPYVAFEIQIFKLHE